MVVEKVNEDGGLTVGGWGGGDYNVLKWGGMEKQGGELES